MPNLIAAILVGTENSTGRGKLGQRIILVETENSRGRGHLTENSTDKEHLVVCIKMKNWELAVDQWLPHWFESAGMQWTQWVYALWQIFRCNRIGILLLSLPFYLWHRYYTKAKIVWLDETHLFGVGEWERGQYPIELGKLEVIRERGKFCMARYGKYCYVTETSNVKKLSACLKCLGEENIIFVERALRITSSLFVAKKISEREAAQQIFSRDIACHVNRHVANESYWCDVVPTYIDYVELSNKLWGVLSSIPILLQARSYNRFSALLSLVIILLDLNRGWLYNLYDSIFNSFTKFVKLNLFKQRTNLYVFFSIFSSRWGYCDFFKEKAYMEERGKEIHVRYAELESPQDLQIVGEGMCDGTFSEDADYYMEIVKDRAHWQRHKGVEYAKAITGRSFYVSDHSVASTLNIGKGSEREKTWVAAHLC